MRICTSWGQAERILHALSCFAREQGEYTGGGHGLVVL